MSDSAKKQDGSPSTNGRFQRGNKLATGGNAAAAKASKLRLKLINAVTEKDIADIAQTLIDKAKAGDIQAVKELFDRVFGKATQAVELSGSVEQVVKVVSGVSMSDL